VNSNLRMALLTLLICFLPSTSMPVWAAAPAPDPLADGSHLQAIFRDAKASSDLRIQVGAKSFSILRADVTRSDKAAAEALMQNGLRDLEFSYSAQGRTESYEVSSRVFTEKTTPWLDTDGTETWNIRRLVPVARLPREKWEEFLEFALRNGVSQVHLVEPNRGTVGGTLLMTGSGTREIHYGPQRLVLSEEFYDSMKLSSEYPSASGPNGFVVLVHDPHGNTLGRQDLKLGLDAMLRANPTTTVDFLVEGACLTESNYSPPPTNLQERPALDGGLATILGDPSAPTTTGVINSMLKAYLIDTPLAYRLLNPARNIPAYCIDNNQLLLQDQASSKIVPPSRNEVKSAIVKVSAGLDAAVEASDGSPDQKQRAKSNVTAGSLTLIRRLTSGTHGVPEARLPEFFNACANELAAFASVARNHGLASSRSKELDTIDQQVAWYRQENSSYGIALLRTKTMLRYIAPEARQAIARLPIAFIGSYHTHDIVLALAREQIGYVVVEPRFHARPGVDEIENRAFQDFLQHPKNYFQSTFGTNKGWASLSSGVVTEIHKPLIPNASHSIEARSASIERAKATAGNDVTVQPSALANALSSNATLVDAGVSFGGGGAGMPPDPPAGTFAFFSMDGHRPNLLITDPRDPRWSGDDRYRILGLAAIGMIEVRDSGVRRRVLDRRRDSSSGREYFFLYDSKAQGVYLVECPPKQAAALMTLPAMIQSSEIHIQVTENRSKGEAHEQQSHIGS
jgi:hypothetical protein